MCSATTRVAFNGSAPHQPRVNCVAGASRTANASASAGSGSSTRPRAGGARRQLPSCPAEGCPRVPRGCCAGGGNTSAPTGEIQSWKVELAERVVLGGDHVVVLGAGAVSCCSLRLWRAHARCSASMSATLRSAQQGSSKAVRQKRCLSTYCPGVLPETLPRDYREMGSRDGIRQGSKDSCILYGKWHQSSVLLVMAGRKAPASGCGMLVESCSAKVHHHSENRVFHSNFGCENQSRRMNIWKSL